MTSSDSERKEANKPRRRMSAEKRSSYVRMMLPIQFGGMAFILIELAVLYIGGTVLAMPRLPVVGAAVVGVAVYLWFCLRWFRRYREWQREWRNRA